MQLTKKHKIHTNTNESMHSEMSPVAQNPIQRSIRTAHLSVLMTAHNFSTQYYCLRKRVLVPNGGKPLLNTAYGSTVTVPVLGSCTCTSRHLFWKNGKRKRQLALCCSNYMLSKWGQRPAISNVQVKLLLNGKAFSQC